MERRDCQVLGLQDDLFDRFNFDKFSEEVRGHFCRGEWICEFLEENYMRLTEDSGEYGLQPKQILEKIGFRANGVAIETILGRLAALRGHSHILDLVKSYIMDEYKYNPALSKHPGPEFPVRISRDDPEVNPVRVIQRGTRCRSSSLEQSIRRHLGAQNGYQTVLYHGTDHDSAASILTGGIRIIEGAKRRDFSDGRGFYLTPDLQYALDWAFNSTRKPAVLVYQADSSKIKSFKGYSLSGRDKEDKWKEHVKQYQSGHPTKQLRRTMEEYDYVVGPRSASYDPDEPKPEHNTTQLCILSSKLAQTMNGFLDLVVIYGAGKAEPLNGMY